MKVRTRWLLRSLCICWALAGGQAWAADDCSSICVEARIAGDHWVLLTTDRSGQIRAIQKTEIPSSEPLDVWLRATEYLEIPGDKTRGGDSPPPPPPGGTGETHESYSYPGYQNGRAGYFFVSITYTFLNFQLVDVKVNTYFKAMSELPPPDDDQVN
ncbi:MAG: hypothetical protein Kow0020_06650 [Wenzhouxiangellaceae bacterium]